MNIPVFDLHCDTPLALLGKDLTGGVSLMKNKGHIDLTRARSLYGYAQCFACFTTPMMRQWYQASPVLIFEHEMGATLEQIEKYPDLIRQAYTAADVRDNLKNHRMSAILTIEGPAGFDYDPALLPDLYAVGFRMTTLGWNEKNPLTGSHETGGGLTEQGREYLEEAQRCGMIVDVSHISDEGFWDIMELTTAPVIASHSNSRAVRDISRNITDDMFRAICQTGGVVGMNQYADFVGAPATLDGVCDHVIHFLEMDPEGKHIALGGDLDGCEELSEGFADVGSYPAFAKRLLERGVDETLLSKIFWENALGVMEKCCI